MSGHMSLSAWLRFQIAKDKKTALSAEPDHAGMWRRFGNDGFEDHILTWQPRRVLADLEGKELLVTVHSAPHTIVDGWCVECGGDCTHKDEDDCILCGSAFTPCQSLRLLTMGFTERSGFREEWRAFSDRPQAAAGGKP